MKLQKQLQEQTSFLVTHEVDLEDKIKLRDVILMQEAVPAIDKHLWLG